MNARKEEIFSQLCEIVKESEQCAIDVMNHLDLVMNSVTNLEDSKNIKGDIDGIINAIMTTMSSMQMQDAHRQKIERVANLVDPDNNKFARAKHITGDASDDQVDDDELAALIAAANN